MSHKDLKNKSLKITLTILGWLITITGIIIKLCFQKDYNDITYLKNLSNFREIISKPSTLISTISNNSISQNLILSASTSIASASTILIANTTLSLWIVIPICLTLMAIAAITFSTLSQNQATHKPSNTMIINLIKFLSTTLIILGSIGLFVNIFNIQANWLKPIAIHNITIIISIILLTLTVYSRFTSKNNNYAKYYACTTLAVMLSLGIISMLLTNNLAITITLACFNILNILISSYINELITYNSIISTIKIFIITGAITAGIIIGINKIPNVQLNINNISEIVIVLFTLAIIISSIKNHVNLTKQAAKPNDNEENKQPQLYKQAESVQQDHAVIGKVTPV